MDVIHFFQHKLIFCCLLKHMIKIIWSKIVTPPSDPLRTFFELSIHNFCSWYIINFKKIHIFLVFGVVKWQKLLYKKNNLEHHSDFLNPIYVRITIYKEQTWMCLYIRVKKTQVKKEQKWGYYYLSILPLFLLILYKEGKWIMTITCTGPKGWEWFLTLQSFYPTIRQLSSLESNFTWISLRQKNKKTYKGIKEKKHSNY